MAVATGRAAADFGREKTSYAAQRAS